VIQRCRSEYPVKLMCRCLNVCTSGDFAWTTRGPSVRARADRRRVERMREIDAESDGVIGAPRLHETLTYEGERVGRNRVARLMAADGLYGLPQRRRWRRKASGLRPVPVGNHLNRDFSAAEPNTRWATDITYIRTAEAWLYLCVVIDLYSRAVVGWSMTGARTVSWC
jgi:putative transposase